MATYQHRSRLCPSQVDPLRGQLCEPTAVQPGRLRAWIGARRPQGYRWQPVRGFTSLRSAAPARVMAARLAAPMPKDARRDAVAVRRLYPTTPPYTDAAACALGGVAPIAWSPSAAAALAPRGAPTSTFAAPCGPYWLPRGVRVGGWFGGGLGPFRPSLPRGPLPPAFAYQRSLEVASGALLPPPEAALAAPRSEALSAASLNFHLSDLRAAKRLKGGDLPRERALALFAAILSEQQPFSPAAQQIATSGETFSHSSPSLIAMCEVKKTPTLSKRACSIGLYGAWSRTSGCSGYLFPEAFVYD